MRGEEILAHALPSLKSLFFSHSRRFVSMALDF
uniref:Uncharacterized protein n=1 Tax=Magnetospirillum gryphiswaldense TaxID=55518 RepID=A4TVC3_9PROT|nr:hypothetical protein MGR_1911 [Magnetospirillum gryphiswaldense MSR-1]